MTWLRTVEIENLFPVVLVLSRLFARLVRFAAKVGTRGSGENKLHCHIQSAVGFPPTKILVVARFF